MKRLFLAAILVVAPALMVACDSAQNSLTGPSAADSATSGNGNSASQTSQGVAPECPPKLPDGVPVAPGPYPVGPVAGGPDQNYGCGIDSRPIAPRP
jgi:hypothetical protein